MAKKANPTVIGAFVLGAIVLAVGAVLIIGGGEFMHPRNYAVMYFEDSISGLDAGAPVKLKGARIGSVHSVQLQVDRGTGDVRIPIVIQIEPERFVTVDDSGERDGDLELLIQRGLRAKLVNQSLLTGKQSISLDYYPNAEDTRRGFPCEHPEIPTLPKTLAQLEKKFEELPLAEIVDELHQTAKGLSELVNNPALSRTITNLEATVVDVRETIARLNTSTTKVGSELSDRAGQVIETLDLTLKSASRFTSSMEGQLAPMMDSWTNTATRAADLAGSLTELSQDTASLLDEDSAVRAELSIALQEFTDALRSIRQLADALERNPESLLRGKGKGE